LVFGAISTVVCGSQIYAHAGSFRLDTIKAGADLWVHRWSHLRDELALWCQESATHRGGKLIDSCRIHRMATTKHYGDRKFGMHRVRHLDKIRTSANEHLG
jgi:hypothetical protein